MMEVSFFGLSVYIVWNVLSVVVLAPLECAMVRLSVQRPERQQPLHLAYAQRNQSSGPSPYSHQASANAQTQPGGAYSDQSSTNQQKPLPKNPQDGSQEAPNSPPDLSRPSFAIEDDEEENEVEGDKKAKVEDARDEDQPPRENSNGNENPSPFLNEVPNTTSTSQPTPTPQENIDPSRVLGGQTNPSSYPVYDLPSPSTEPHEPVIALRPCDEPRSA